MEGDFKDFDCLGVVLTSRSEVALKEALELHALGQELMLWLPKQDIVSWKT